MGVLGGSAFSYERGTPVELSDTCRDVGGRLVNVELPQELPDGLAPHCHDLAPAQRKENEYLLNL